jgi:uncharacterized protein YjbJ (UPF0337 family)
VGDRRSDSHSVADLAVRRPQLIIGDNEFPRRGNRFSFAALSKSRPNKDAGALELDRSADVGPVERAMDWYRIEGNWNQIKGRIKERWGEILDDDLEKIEGRRDRFIGEIQEHYGRARKRRRAGME